MLITFPFNSHWEVPYYVKNPKYISGEQNNDMPTQKNPVELIAYAPVTMIYSTPKVSKGKGKGKSKFKKDPSKSPEWAHCQHMFR